MILLSVQEPVGDFVLSGVLHDCDDALNLQQTGDKLMLLLASLV